MEPPPTNHVFETRNEAQKYCQKWAKEHGYAVVTQSTRRRDPPIGSTESSEIYKVWLQCDRGGKPRKVPTNQQARSRTSQKIDCPFRLLLRQDSNLNWSIDQLNSAHNHNASARPQQHAIHRRQARTEVSGLISANQHTGFSARDTFNALHMDIQHDTLQTLKDIQNAYSSQKRQENYGVLPIQAMMNNLGDDFVYAYERDAFNCLIRLVFCFKKMIQLLILFPDSMVLDITYKTNRFGMFLLNIIGCTATNETFVCGQALLTNEDTASLTWALNYIRNLLYMANQLSPPVSITSDRALSILNAVSTVFPESSRLICAWHVNRDVLGKVTKYFRQRFGDLPIIDRDSQINQSRTRFMNAWHAVQYAKTEEEYRASVIHLYTTYMPTNHELVEYLDREWLPHRRLFIPVWTNQIRHFGNTSSNRVEGIYTVVKKQLNNLRIDLQELIECLKRYFLASFD